MKYIYILIGVYIVALALSIYGYIIDTDPIIDSFAHQMFEVFMLSIIVFGILILPFYILYSLFLFFKKIKKRRQLID